MKILVYQIGQLGDTIVSIPALRSVRQYFGKTALIILLHDATHRLVTSEMVLDGSGLVDEFIPYVPEKTTVRKLRTMASLGRRLRHKRFDAVVSLLPSDRPRWALVRDRLFFRTCGIRRLIGFQPFEEAQFRPRDEFGRPAPTPNEAIFRVERLVAGNIASPQENYFALPLMQVSREHSDAVDGWLTSRRVYPQRPLIALCPGCKKPGNSWPRERFLDIAKRLLALNQHELLILGGPAERELAACLVDGLGGRAIHAAGCFSISESAALLARCALLVGLDTGTTHLAAAVGVPCVVLQSANSFPGQWNPLGEGHTVLRAEVACAGCLLQECPFADHPCMSNLTVEQAWEAIDKVISHEHHTRYTHA